MMSALTAVPIFLMHKIAKSKNPVSMAFMLMTLASTNFAVMAMSSSESWANLILLTIFLGGILMMFMILSSVLPNEPSSKTKNHTNMTSLLVVSASIASLVNSSPYYTQNQDSAKMMVATLQNTLALVIVMSLYFLIFNKFIQAKKISMRSFDC